MNAPRAQRSASGGRELQDCTVVLLGAALIAGDPFSARMFEKAARLAHLGVAEPEDLVDSIVFLAGPESRRITGQALSVNGGISAA